MNTSNILAELRGERDRINEAIAALESLDSSASHYAYKKGKKQSGVAPVVKHRRKMSAAARKRISDAAKRRWAEIRKAKAAAKA